MMVIQLHTAMHSHIVLSVRSYIGQKVQPHRGLISFLYFSDSTSHSWNTATGYRDRDAGSEHSKNLMARSFEVVFDGRSVLSAPPARAAVPAILGRPPPSVTAPRGSLPPQNFFVCEAPSGARVSAVADVADAKRRHWLQCVSEVHNCTRTIDAGQVHSNCVTRHIERDTICPYYLLCGFCGRRHFADVVATAGTAERPRNGAFARASSTDDRRSSRSDQSPSRTKGFPCRRHPINHGGRMWAAVAGHNTASRTQPLSLPIDIYYRFRTKDLLATLIQGKYSHYVSLELSGLGAQCTVKDYGVLVCCRLDSRAVVFLTLTATRYLSSHSGSWSRTLCDFAIRRNNNNLNNCILNPLHEDIQGMKNKELEVELFMDSANIDILCITEHWLRNDRRVEQRLGSLQVLTSNSGCLHSCRFKVHRADAYVSGAVDRYRSSRRRYQSYVRRVVWEGMERRNFVSKLREDEVKTGLPPTVVTKENVQAVENRFEKTEELLMQILKVDLERELGIGKSATQTIIHDHFYLLGLLYFVHFAHCGNKSATDPKANMLLTLLPVLGKVLERLKLASQYPTLLRSSHN
ncbi:hypothetical protein EVAR_87845_1 [Eumeta japonica]|uniref:Uncharacterized protein n=1 Tax=Eumeta variegata TaxID=151549 RepID=A0A4C1YG00_EUMVA|nr:hypothetical protein EVAR_87845_1 [Eumeta japonica]